MDEDERQMWCKAWRLLVKHGDDTLSMIDTEIALALHRGDHESITGWRQLADAVEHLAN